MTNASSPKARSLLRVTIDTNVLIGGLEGGENERAAFAALLRMRNEGRIEIALSSRFEKDKERDSDIQRVREHFAIARLFPLVPAPFRLDVSRLDVDAIADGELADRLDDIFPSARRLSNTTWDVDHLHAHVMAGRDCFLTWDKGILKKSDRLRDLGITVMPPEAFVQIHTAASTPRLPELPSRSP